jgi:conjugative relaxase-like TrwC/TraI family protein
MLNVSEAMTADAVRGYFPEGGHDYFIDGFNLPGIWGGRLAGEFGLKGEVRKEHFDRMADGYHPFTGEDLVLRRTEDRRSANDITISAPKGFSLIYLAEPDEGKRRKLLQTYVETCDWIMDKMEADAATRVRVGGADEDRKSQNWAYAGFLQFDSRTDDRTHLPVIQIHRHHTVFNLSRDPEEQRVKALQIGEVKKNADLWMPLFHNELARRVRALGLGIKREPETGIVGFGIEGISRPLIDRNSPRRQTILEAKERIARQGGITDPERLRRLQAELGKLTRKHKQKNLSRQELWDLWQRQLSPEDRSVILAAWGQEGWVTTDAEAARHAIEHVFYRQTVVPEKKLLIEGLRYGVGSVTLDGLSAELKRQGVLVKDGQATTEALRREEREFCDFSRGGLGKCRPLVAGPVDLDRLLAPAPGQKPAVRPSGDQAGVLRALVASRNAVNVVDAGQGTGKTTLLEHFAAILARMQVRATWLGTTHTAVDELKARGLPAMTLAHFLASKEEQRKAAGTRIVVDESSMLAHRDAHRLFMYARDNGRRIDVVGDTKQYKTPSAGDPMTLLLRFGGVKPFTMSRTMRQQGRLKEAMEAIRDGDVLKGHDILNELGFVREIPLDRLTQTAAELYLDWSAKGAFVPVISPTHAQADDIAARIRAGLRERGDLTGEDRTVRRLVNLNWTPAQIKDAKKHGGAEGVVLTRYGAYREATQALAVGDLVRTTMGGKTKDGQHALKNGQKYRIDGFTKDGDPILSNGAVVDKGWGGLVQRYVGTGQSAQGLTAPRAIVVYGTPSLVATRREGFYVPVSRVRTEVAVLTDSAAALRQAIQRQDTRTFATELFPARERQRTTLRQRLGKHLAFLRRQAAFGRTHKTNPQGRPPPDRGYAYER